MVAPVRSNGSPTGVLAAGTTSTTISLSTNLNSTCKYGTTAGVAYASLPSTFTTTGGLNHSASATVSSGNPYTFYVRCQDGVGNVNTNDFVITFSVASATAPIRSNGAPTGSLVAGTTSTPISLTTDKSATCKYGTAANTAYASIGSTFTTTGTTSHSQSITGLTDGVSRTFYVRCSAAATNTDDFVIAFTVDAQPVPFGMHWKFDDGSETTALDSTAGGANPGTLTGGPTWVTGCVVGGAACLLFNGVNDSVERTLSTAYTGNYTISLWARSSTATPAANKAIFSSSAGAGTGTFQIDTNGAGGYRISVDSTVVITPVTTEWQLITVSLNGTTMKTYNNGR